MEGTFKAFSKHLPRLQAMGADIIWIMPVHPIGERNRKGGLGSYYSVKDYTAINPEFGTMDDFLDLVDAIHKTNMRVIIDWVANHTAWDHEWTHSHPAYYTRDSLGHFTLPEADWTDTIDLDYSNPDLREAMLRAMIFWVKKTDIDGFRCDVADKVPLDFWITVRETLDTIKPVFLLAEADKPEMHKAFDMTYSWRLKDLMNGIADKKSRASDLWHYLEEEKKRFPPDAYRMLFTTNHDENSWHGTVFQRLGPAAEVMNVLCGLLPGMPLIYSGEEAGLNKSLSFFEKDPIPWKEHPFKSLFTRLCLLKEKNRALRNGIQGGEAMPIESGNDPNLFCFYRQAYGDRIVAVLNLSDVERSFTIRIPSGLAGQYLEVFQDETVTLEGSIEICLPEWGYKVWSSERESYERRNLASLSGMR
jgi:glycosidase